MKSGVKWPVFAPRDSGKSLPVDRSPSYLGSCNGSSMPAYADRRRTPAGSRLERDAVLRFLSPPTGVVPGTGLALESGKKVISHGPSIVSSTPNSPARRTACHGPSETGVAWTQGRQSGVLYPSAPAAGGTSKGVDRHFHPATGSRSDAGTYGQAILTLHERHSRMRSGRPVKRHLPSPVPGGDPGASANRVASDDRLRWFVMNCMPSASRLRLLTLAEENAIGRMRRSLPRKTDLVHLPEERFTQMLQAYNNTPRKCLGYQTPAETFWNKVLRFKNPPSGLRRKDGLRGGDRRCSSISRVETVSMPPPLGPGLRRGDGGEKGAGSGFHGNDIWGAWNGSGKRIWRMLGGIVVDHDSRSARRFKWGSWMAKSQL